MNDPLYRWFLRRLRRPDLAEEYTQEVYARMLAIPKDTVIENYPAYVKTVARNLLYERSLREGRTKFEQDVDDPAIQEQLSEFFDYGEDIDKEMYKKLLHEALRELSPKCQAAVAMHFWRGMTYEEIAPHLEISVHMVKKYICQALAHLRTRMGGLA
jgi:RNA polymerase sigma-70 factor (ECF subfamily)